MQRRRLSAPAALPATPASAEHRQSRAMEAPLPTEPTTLPVAQTPASAGPVGPLVPGSAASDGLAGRWAPNTRAATLPPLPPAAACPPCPALPSPQSPTQPHPTPLVCLIRSSQKKATPLPLGSALPPAAAWLAAAAPVASLPALDAPVVACHDRRVRLGPPGAAEEAQPSLYRLCRQWVQNEPDLGDPPGPEVRCACVLARDSLGWESAVQLCSPRASNDRMTESMAERQAGRRQ